MIVSMAAPRAAVVNALALVTTAVTSTADESTDTTKVMTPTLEVRRDGNETELASWHPILRVHSFVALHSMIPTDSPYPYSTACLVAK